MINWRTSKLIDRIGWAKANLKPVRTEYCVVYEDIDMKCATVLHPDPHCMAMLMHGGLMPPVEVWHKLAEDEARTDFTQHSDFRGHLLHDTEPMGPLTEEEAVEFLIKKDIPAHIWKTWDQGNKPKMVVCRRSQLPATREWRNAWRIADELGEKAA